MGRAGWSRPGSHCCGFGRISSNTCSRDDVAWVLGIIAQEMALARFDGETSIGETAEDCIQAL